MTYNFEQAATAAGAFFAAMGAVVYGLKKNGLITFGKPKERRHCVKVCEEHDRLVDIVKTNKELLKTTTEKIDVVDGKVDRILGHLGKL